MSETERVFFNKFITKNFTPVNKSGEERFFEGYLTVEMVDKQNEITIVDELMKVLPVWMSRGAPISDTHSNRIVGRGINYQKTSITENGVNYPAIYIKGMIHDNYELDHEIWHNIQSGKYKGLSFGGATKSDRIPITNKDGTTSYALKDLEQYEVAVCEDPAVPLALITQFNPVAKSMVIKNNGKYIQKSEREHCIRCYSFGCFVDKMWQDTKIVDDSPQAEGLPDKDKKKDGEWSDTHGINTPQNDEQKVHKDPPKITAGNQRDPTGECFEAVAHCGGQEQTGFDHGNLSADSAAAAGHALKTENEAFKPNDELLGAAGKAGREDMFPKQKIESVDFKENIDGKPKLWEFWQVDMKTHEKVSNSEEIVSAEHYGQAIDDYIANWNTEHPDNTIGYPMAQGRLHKSEPDEEDDKEKTLNPGENMNMEKPIRGLRGTGGLGGSGQGGSSMLAGAKSTNITKPIRGRSWEEWEDKLMRQGYSKESTGGIIGQMEADDKAMVEKYDYDMSKIIDDPTTMDPRKDTKKLAGPTLEANQSEDGVNLKQRVNDDPTAQGLEPSSSDSTKAEIPYAVGGTRGGSYENTSQDTNQWDTRVTPAKDAKHTRETIRVQSGEKDSLNTINTAMKTIKDKLNAIEIRRVIKNI